MRLALPLAALVLCVSRPCFGQACCTATGASDVGIVPPGARAAVAVETSWEHATHSFDAQGRSHGLRGTRADDWVLSLGGGARPFEALQLHAAVPTRFQRRRFVSESSQTHLGLGDSLVGARFVAHDDPLPAHGRARFALLEPFVAARLPTGRAATEAETATGVDATGDGAVQLGAGVDAAVRLPRVHWVDGGVGFSLRLPHRAAGRELDPGDELSAKLGYAWVPDVFLSLGARVTYRGTLPARESGHIVPDSVTHRLRVGAFVRHTLDYPRWYLLSSLSSDMPLDGLGRNVPYAGFTLSLSLQRVFQG